MGCLIDLLRDQGDCARSPWENDEHENKFNAQEVRGCCFVKVQKIDK